jgi:hypothetical protein
LKISKNRILFETFKNWNKKYKLSQQKKKMKEKSLNFMKKKYFNEYLTRWLNKLANKMQK